MKISASIRPHKPTPEERKALKGETNVEALLNALDQRLTEKAEVVLVGRASYEIGDREFTKRIKERLNEEEKIDNRTGKIHLTDDIDCYCSESAEPIINIGHPNSYVADLANCYVHALNERTLILPNGWRERLQPVAGQLTNLSIKRLDPLDFIICKGAAGRPKDHKFLGAFCQVMNIQPEEVNQKIQETLTNPPFQLKLDTSAQKFLKMLPGKLFPPDSPKISTNEIS
jgi:hypothetical protein